MLVNGLNGTSQAETLALLPSTRALFQYWEKLRGAESAPTRARLDMRKFAGLVPSVMILEHSGRFKWRLAGTRICSLFRHELTGTDALAGLDRFQASAANRLLCTTIDTLRPCLLKFQLQTDRHDRLDAEMIGLPILARDGKSIHVFGGMFSIQDPFRMVYDAITHVSLAGEHHSQPCAPPGNRIDTHQARAFRVIRGGRTN